MAVGRRSRTARGQRELRGRRCTFDDVDAFERLRRSPRARAHHQGADRPAHRLAQPGAVHGLTSRSSEPSGAPSSAASRVLEEEAVLDHARHGLDGRGERGQVGPGRERAVQDVVPLVGDEGRAVGLAAPARRRRAGAAGGRACPPSRSARPRPAGASARPGASTSLRASATITQRRADSITSFSRSSAPPPPFSTARLAHHLVGAVEREIELGRLAPATPRESPRPPPGAPSRATRRRRARGARRSRRAPRATPQTARPEPRPEAHAGLDQLERRAHRRRPRRIGAQCLTSAAARRRRQASITGMSAGDVGVAREPEQLQVALLDDLEHDHDPDRRRRGRRARAPPG